MATDHSDARRPRRRMSAEERERHARLAAHAMHARNDSRAVTANARRAFLDRFEHQVDPDGVLPVAERCRRAEHAKREHMLRLALRSAQVRRRRAAGSAE
jgi:hypothetical protein